LTNKKVEERWNFKKSNSEIISNKINSNQNNMNQIWQIKKLKKDEIEKNLISLIILNKINNNQNNKKIFRPFFSLKFLKSVFKKKTKGKHFPFFNVNYLFN
jgi:hypothetical protein